MLKLYENIKMYRKAAKMTQEELARLTGYTDRSSIARVEKGEIDLPQSKIKQFAVALGTTPGRLMGWEDSPVDAGALAAKVLKNPAASRLMQTFFELDEGDQYALGLMAESLKAKKKD